MLFFTRDLSIWDSGTNKCFSFCFAIDFFCPNPGFGHTTKQQSAELRPPSSRCSASTSGRVTKHPQPLDQNSCKLQQKHSQASQQVCKRLVNGERNVSKNVDTPSRPGRGWMPREGLAATVSPGGGMGQVTRQGGGNSATLYSQREAKHRVSPLWKLTWSWRGRRGAGALGWEEIVRGRLGDSAGKETDDPPKIPVLEKPHRSFPGCYLKYTEGSSQTTKKPMLWPVSVPHFHTGTAAVKGGNCFVWGDTTPLE